MDQPRHLSASFARAPLIGMVLLSLAYLIFPVVVVVVISFSGQKFLSFPPASFSTVWYRDILTSADWAQSFWITIRVGVLAAFLSVGIGLPAAFALVRRRIPGKGVLEALLLAALITPPIIKGLSLYLFYAPLGLNNTVVGLALAHTVTGVPFVILNVSASLRGFDMDLERAAVIHGCSQLGALRRVTIPIIMPGIIVGTVFAFLQSAQELLVALFVMGSVQRPLAVKLWESVRVSIDPSIAAASTLLIAFAVVAFVLASVLQWRRRLA